MPSTLPEMTTDRLTLRPWTRDDSTVFAELNADPEVMSDLGGPLTRAESDRKLDRYIEAFETNGYGRWAIEHSGGNAPSAFLGYAGVMPVGEDHPLGQHHEIGWRLRRDAWGQGLATEAAEAALRDAFARAGLAEILSYTSPDNVRSRAVMRRLGLRRHQSLDFVAHYEGLGEWRGLVWIAIRPDYT